MHGVEPLEGIELTEEESVASSNFCADGFVITDDLSSTRFSDGSEKSGDIRAIGEELVLAVRVDKHDSVEVPNPCRNPVSMRFNVFADSGGIWCGELEVSDSENLLRMGVDGDDAREDLVKVDEAIGDDIAPDRLGDCW